MISTLLERFAEAITTGKQCRTSDNGRRRYPALGLGGLGLLTRHKLWPQAMRLAVEIGLAHPDAQRRFLDAWMRVGCGSTMRPEVGDDDLLLTALRILLPAYDGPPMILYRGQLPDDPIGLSWSRSRHIAVKFALYADANVDPLDLEASARRRGLQPRQGTVLRALAQPDAIICAPCLLGHAEGEYIVDPRRLDSSAV
jgi:hypothetical protein